MLGGGGAKGGRGATEGAGVTTLGPSLILGLKRRRAYLGAVYEMDNRRADANVAYIVLGAKNLDQSIKIKILSTISNEKILLSNTRQSDTATVPR